MLLNMCSGNVTDKTKHFQDQIEAKQRELQPWAAKTNEAQRRVDVCSNERETLVQKARDAQKALAEAQEQLKGLQDTQVTKVLHILYLILMHSA